MYLSKYVMGPFHQLKFLNMILNQKKIFKMKLNDFNFNSNKKIKKKSNALISRKRDFLVNNWKK